MGQPVMRMQSWNFFSRVVIFSLVKLLNQSSSSCVFLMVVFWSIFEYFTSIGCRASQWLGAAIIIPAVPKKDLFELTSCLAIAHQIIKLICFLLNWTKNQNRGRGRDMLHSFYQPRSGMVLGWVAMLFFLFWLFFWGRLAFDQTFSGFSGF